MSFPTFMCGHSEEVPNLKSQLLNEEIIFLKQKSKLSKPGPDGGSRRNRCGGKGWFRGLRLSPGVTSPVGYLACCCSQSSQAYSVLTFKTQSMETMKTFLVFSCIVERINNLRKTRGKTQKTKHRTTNCRNTITAYK